jgi:hypothetical protein
MNTMEIIQMKAMPRKAGFANGVFTKLLPISRHQASVVERAN